MMQLSVYKEHYKETIRLGVPIMLGQLGIIVVGFADNIMVGHHSTAELAAASFVNNFFNLVFIAGMGFSYGLTPIIGGYFAQKEYAKAGETLKNSLCINLIVGLLLSLCMLTLLLNIHILKQPGRVDALYRALLYPATLLGHFRHAVQLVQAVQRRHDRHGHPDVRHVRSQRAQHHRELLADIRQLRMP